MKTIFIILMLAAGTFGQNLFPELGTLEDIKGKTKFYLAADAFNTKWMLKEFKNNKTLVRVDKPEDAEFIIEYETVHRGDAPSGFLGIRYEEGEMNVYLFRENKKKVIAWRDSAKTGLNMPSIQLAKRFLKAIKVDKPAK